MNIVPVTFKTESLFYIKDIVKKLSANVMYNEDPILAMKSIENSDLKEPMDVLWLSTKKTHTEFVNH